MRLAILTTDTLHHAYFLQKLAETHEPVAIFAETNVLRAPFDTAHPYLQEQEAYEAAQWFAGKTPGIADFAAVQFFPSMNDPEAVAALRDAKPDVVVVFGTGRLKSDVISVCPQGIINLHGGNPERYRGLDTHLWAIYHNDFPGLSTTLHTVNEQLDDGEVILEADISLQKDMGLHMLRRFNTEACVQMTLSALDMYGRFGGFVKRRQRENGRYYSFMPSALKDICVKKFAKYTSTI